MNSCELTAGITAIANGITSDLDNDELALLASIQMQLGDTLVAIVTFAKNIRTNNIMPFGYNKTRRYVMEVIEVILTSVLSAVSLFLIAKIMGHKQMSQLDFF